MAVLFATHPAYLEHLTGPGHPERPARLQAVLAGAEVAGVAEALVPLEPVAASREDLERVHPAWYLDRIDAMAEVGGGWIDADTRVSARSCTAAYLAAGAGFVTPIAGEMRRISADRAYVDAVLRDGGERAGAKAEATMKTVREIIGLLDN